MKKKLISILCVSALLLSACGNSNNSNQDNSGNETQNKIEAAESVVNGVKNDISEALLSEVHISECTDNAILSLYEGKDFYNKTFNDANDEYNSKATSADEFEYQLSGYNEGYAGTISINGYNGSSTDVIIPSMIDGALVTYINFEEIEGIKNLTIPDTVVEIYGAEYISSVENISYNGTLFKCPSNSFAKSPVYAKLTSSDGFTILGKTLIDCTNVETIVDVPEGIESICCGDARNPDVFSNGPETVNMPTTLKYLYISFPESVQIVNFKSPLLGVLGGHINSKSSYLNCIDDKYITLNNVLIKLVNTNDPNTAEKDYIIPKDINVIYSGALSFPRNSVKFEADNIIIDNIDSSMDLLFFVTADASSYFSTNDLDFGADKHYHSLRPNTVLGEIENVTLPKEVDIFSGCFLGKCKNVNNFPEHIEYYICHDPEKSDCACTQYIDKAKAAGAMIIYM